MTGYHGVLRPDLSSVMAEAVSDLRMLDHQPRLIELTSRIATIDDPFYMRLSPMTYRATQGWPRRATHEELAEQGWVSSADLADLDDFSDLHPTS